MSVLLIDNLHPTSLMRESHCLDILKATSLLTDLSGKCAHLPHVSTFNEDVVVCYPWSRTNERDALPVVNTMRSIIWTKTLWQVLQQASLPLSCKSCLAGVFSR